MHDSCNFYVHIKACKKTISTQLNTVFSSYCYVLRAQFTLWMSLLTQCGVIAGGKKLPVPYIFLSKKIVFSQQL